MKDYLLERMAEEEVSTESDSVSLVAMWLAPWTEKPGFG